MNRWVASLLVWLPFFLLSIPPAAHARIYKWVDAQGRIHYSDTPVGNAAPVDDTLPPASIFTLPPEATPAAAKPTEPDPGAVAPQAPSPTVVVPPTEDELTDDAPPADTEPTAQDNPPNIADAPENVPEEESVAPPSLTADAPDVSLPPDAALENQFGPGNEFENKATGEEDRQ